MGDRPQSDRELAERVLSGRMDPADAPPELAPLAAMVRRAAEVPASAAIDDALVAAMATAITDSTAPHTTRRSRKPMLAELLTAKVAAVAATTILGVTTAAAATGTLPDPVQDKVASVAEHVGVDLPDSASDRAKEVHRILAETEPGRERGKALSQKPETEDGDDQVTGQERATQAKAEAEERKAAAEERKAAAQARAAEAKADAGTEDERETPPVSVPNDGGTETGDTASEDASETGTTTADEKSGGASTDGAGNADRGQD